MTILNTTFSNIVLIAGSGRHVGKSFLGEHLIKLISPNEPVLSLKISSHFHPPTAGLNLLKEDIGWRIFEEQSSSDNKDSERFLLAGASQSYYAEVEMGNMQSFINELYLIIDISKIILVESATFGNFIKPNLAFYVNGNNDNKCRWDFDFYELKSINSKIVKLPKNLNFINNKWQIVW